MALASELGDDVGHVLELAHSANVSAELLLGKFLSTLLLRVADELNETALVRGKTGDLGYQGSNERGLLGDNGFASRKSRLDLPRGDLVTFVVTNSETGLRSRSHCNAEQ